MHRLRLDQVVVVQDQHHLVGSSGQLVDQRRHQPLERRRCRRAEQRGDPLGDPRPHPLQRGDHMPPEPRRVVVGFVQRQPPNRPPAAPGPVGQQGCLSKARRGADQGKGPRQSLAELAHQAGPGHKARLRPWQVQLGGQQPIQPADPRLRRVPRRRLSHRALPYSSPRPRMRPSRAHCRALGSPAGCTTTTAPAHATVALDPGLVRVEGPPLSPGYHFRVLGQPRWARGTPPRNGTSR